MTLLSPRILATSSLIALCAGPALADLTPADVWQDWKQRMEGVGHDITATTTQDGDDLVISDIEMAMPMSDGGKVLLSMGSMRFMAQDADTVSFETPTTMHLELYDEGDSYAYGTFDFTLTQTGAVNTATGSADAITYTLQSASSVLTLDKSDIKGRGDVIPPQTVLTATDWEATSVSSQAGALFNIDQSLSIGALSAALSFDDEENDSAMSLAINLSGVLSETDVTMPEQLDTEAPDEMLSAGLTYTGAASAEDMELTASGVIEGESFDVQFTAGEGAHNAALDSDTMRYSFVQQDVSFAMTGSQVPFPIAFEATEGGFQFDMPLQASEDAQALGLGITLRGMTVSEAIWALFDPQQILPRDPADLVVEMDGTALVSAPLVDSDAMEAAAAAGETPVMPETLMLRAFRLAIAGAVMEASGGFSFTGAPTAASGGFPSPVGALDLDLKGANGLLDDLVATGLVGDQEIMAARMMMGLLAVPVGEDHLQSVIEMTEEGHIIANGQRIQ